MTGLVRSSAKAFTGTAKAISKAGKRILPKEGDVLGLNKKLVQNAEHGDKKAGQIHFSPRAPTVSEPVIPLPDEEALDLARRRQRSRRRGARATTVLSGGDADTVG